MKNTAHAGRRTVTPIQLAILTLCAGIGAAHAQSTERRPFAAQANDSGKIPK
jgi:hypothetical protein